jgi:magnesium transporter
MASHSLSSRQTAVVKCVAYKQGVSMGDMSINDIGAALKQDDTFVWLGLREPNDNFLAKVQAEFGLHELAVEDARSAHQHPKLETYGDSLFVVMQTAYWQGNAVHFGETHVFVGLRFVVSVRHGSPLGFGKARERCESSPQQLAKGPGFALYAIMDQVVDNYMPVVAGLHERLQGLEAAIFRQDDNRETLEELYQLKRQLVRLQGATMPLLDVARELMHFHEHIVPPDVRFYYRDVHDHTKRINQAIDNMREMLDTAMQIHLALVTVRQNEVVKRLAGWGAILAIPTMMFSWYGMNFHHMPELDWEYGYESVLAGVVLGCLVLYIRLKRVDWL